jgi:signal peptidase I
MGMEKQKTRSPELAFLLSLVIPGLGQLYNGNLMKGLLLLVGFWVGLAVLVVSHIAYTFYGLAALALLAYGGRLVIALDAHIEAKWSNS